MRLSKNSNSIITKKIDENKKILEINKMIKLPEIIVEKENAYVGASVVSVPNFVTEKILLLKHYLLKIKSRVI